MERWPGGTACLVLLWAIGIAGCATGSETISERVGGRSRRRAAASARAYEAYLRAELAWRSGEHGAAQRELERAQSADPSDGYLSARRAELLLPTDPQRALSVAREATAAHPDQSAAWLVLARALRASGDERGAREAAARALLLDGDDPEVRGLSVDVSGGVRDAAPRSWTNSARRQRAVECFRNGQWSEVDALLTPIVEPLGTLSTLSTLSTLGTPRAMNADRVRLIEARARLGRTMDAARLVAGVSVEGEGSVSRAERARLWLLGGRAQEARAEAQGALERDGSDRRAELVLGESWALLGRWDLALQHFGRISVGDEGFAESREWSARGLAERGLGDIALRVLDQAIGEMAQGVQTGAESQGLRALREALSRPSGGVGGHRAMTDDSVSEP